MQRNFVKLVFGFFSLFASFSIKFLWNYHRGRGEDPYFAPVQSRVHLLVWYFLQLCLPIFALIYSVKLWPLWNDYLSHHQYLLLIFHVYFIVLHLFGMSFQYVFIFRRHQVIQILNQTVKLANHLEEDLFHEDVYKSTRNSLNVTMLIYGLSTIMSVSGVMRPLFLEFHRNYWYIFAYLPDYFYSRGVYPVTLAISFTFQVWFEIMCWGGLGLQIYMVLLFFPTVITTLRQLIKRANTFTSSSGGKEMEKFLLAVLKLRILLGMYNKTLGKYFLPHFNATVGVTTVGSLILLVKFIWNPLILVFSGIFLMITGGNLFILVVLCERVHSLGNELYKILLGKYRGRKLIRKQLDSASIPSVEVGSFYEIRRGTSLTVLGIIFIITTNLLISLSF